MCGGLVDFVFQPKLDFKGTPESTSGIESCPRMRQIQSQIGVGILKDLPLSGGIKFMGLNYFLTEEATGI